MSEAIEALGRLGGAESLPALRRLLGGHAALSDNFRKLQILEAMLRCGDASVVGEVLAIGLAGQHSYYAGDILTRYQPLRDALGFEGRYVEGEGSHFPEKLFYPAADEWYRQSVLGEPRVEQQADFSPPGKAECGRPRWNWNRWKRHRPPASARQAITSRD